MTSFVDPSLISGKKLFRYQSYLEVDCFSLSEEERDKHIECESCSGCSCIQSAVPPLHVVVGSHCLFKNRPVFWKPLAINPCVSDLSDQFCQFGTADGLFFKLPKRRMDKFCW